MFFVLGLLRKTCFLLIRSKKIVSLSSRKKNYHKENHSPHDMKWFAPGNPFEGFLCFRLVQLCNNKVRPDKHFLIFLTDFPEDLHGLETHYIKCLDVTVFLIIVVVYQLQL